MPPGRRGSLFGKVSAPAAVGGDVLGAFEGAGFTEKTFHGGAVFEFHGADAHGSRGLGDETAEGAGAEFPDFELDAGSAETGSATQTWLGRFSIRQGVKPVARSGAAGAAEDGAPGGELVVEWLSAEMRADDGEQDAAAGRGRGGFVDERGAESGEETVAPGGRDEGDAEGQAGGAKAGGDGEGGTVEEIDEIRVGAELGIEFERFGKHVVHAVDARGGGQEQGVDLLPLGLGEAAKALQFIFGAVALCGSPFPGTLDDAAGDGVKGVGILGEEIADGGGALRHAGAGIEELRGITEGGVVDFDDRMPEGRAALDGSGVQSGGFGTAEELALRFGEYA